MKVNGIEKKEKNTVQISVEIPADEFEQALNKAYRKAKGGIMIPGFRKGKAPRKMIERMYGESIFYEDAVNIVAPDAFEQMVKEQELKTVGQPSIDDMNVSDDKTLTLSFITAVYPEVVLGEYKGLEAEKTVETVKKKDIDQELEKLQKRNARILSVEREARDGDTAIIDFEGFLDGVPFEGGQAENHSLTLGSGAFVPGFEEQVIGMKAGEDKDIDVTFPDDYAQELAGKAVVFKVHLHEVKESVLPDLDDEFAKDVSEFDTLDEYKKSIKESLSKEREERAENQFKEAVMAKAVENMTVEVPDAMVDQTLDGMMQEFYYSISSQGMDPQQYLNMLGMDVNTFRESSKTTALERVKTQLLLDAVAEAEEIQVSPEDIEEEFKRLAQQYEMELDAVKKAVEEEGLTGDLKRQKASELIYDSAKPIKKAAVKKTKKADKAEDTEAEVQTEEETDQAEE